MSPEWINLPVRSDARGELLVVDARADLPFEIKRIYTLTKVPAGAVRGGHAHRELRQVVVCLAGGCVVVLDDGRTRAEVRLEGAGRGLLLEKMIWHELRDFAPGSVVQVMTSAAYDEADYIRGREEFLRLCEGSGR